MSSADLHQPRKSNEPVLLSHTSDGIQEYDNPMPLWWSLLFWVTIVYSVLYVMYYEAGVGPTTRSEYESDMGVFYEEQFAMLGDLKPTQQTILQLAGDSKMMRAGAGLFGSHCAVCHAKDGGGLTGPNLCDGSYINIKHVEDLYTVISRGAPDRGMPAWDKRLSEPQRVLLSAYVAHLRGTTPAVAKAPQGEAIAPWTAP